MHSRNINYFDKFESIPLKKWQTFKPVGRQRASSIQYKAVSSVGCRHYLDAVSVSINSIQKLCFIADTECCSQEHLEDIVTMLASCHFLEIE